MHELLRGDVTQRPERRGAPQPLEASALELTLSASLGHSRRVHLLGDIMIGFWAAWMAFILAAGLYTVYLDYTAISQGRREAERGSEEEAQPGNGPEQRRA